MTVEVPSYTRAHVENCSYTRWHPALKHVAIRSVQIPLDKNFVSLLVQDGIKVPTKDETADSNDTITSIREEIEKGIEKLGGAVIPKLNWSAPRDAAWMLGSLKCQSFEDVFMLLKSSDFIMHDISQPFDGCTSSGEDTSTSDTQRTLVLKKWCNFHDSMHFRCFVVERSLVGVSQRFCDQFYAFLLDQQDALCEAIHSFYHQNFATRADGWKFPDRDFVFDVYIDKQRRVHLVDINVFGSMTDPLLFSWEELVTRKNEIINNRPDPSEIDEDEELVDFRVLESEQALKPNPMTDYRVPTDLVDHLAAGGGFDAFMEQVRRDNMNQDDSDSSDSKDDTSDDDDVAWGSDADEYN